MANLTQAQQARAELYLDQNRINTKQWGIITRRQWLENIKAGGGIVEVGEKPSVRYNRRKYNRMSWDEQQEYERKMEIMVPEYKMKAQAGDDSYWEIKKTDYDYFNSL